MADEERETVSTNAIQPLDIRSNFDGIDNGNTITGWVDDPNKPEPSDIDIYIDGALIKTCAAKLFRSDLKAAGIADGCRAFAYTFPDYLCDGMNHVLDIRLSKTSIALFPPAKIRTRSRSLPGQIVRESSTIFSGWLLASGPDITLRIDGDVYDTFPAKVTSNRVGNGSVTRVEFSFGVPSAFRDGSVHRLDVEAPSKTGDVNVVSTSYRAAVSLQGELVSIFGPSLQGWVQDSPHLRSTFKLQVLIDQKLASEFVVRAPPHDQGRRPVVEFDVRLSEDYFDGEVHEVFIREAHENFALTPIPLQFRFMPAIEATFDISQPNKIFGRIKTLGANDRVPRLEIARRSGHEHAEHMVNVELNLATSDTSELKFEHTYVGKSFSISDLFINGLRLSEYVSSSPCNKAFIADAGQSVLIVWSASSYIYIKPVADQSIPGLESFLLLDDDNSEDTIARKIEQVKQCHFAGSKSEDLPELVAEIRTNGHYHLLDQIRRLVWSRYEEADQDLQSLFIETVIEADDASLLQATLSEYGFTQRSVLLPVQSLRQLLMSREASEKKKPPLDAHLPVEGRAAAYTVLLSVIDRQRRLIEQLLSVVE